MRSCRPITFQMPKKMNDRSAYDLGLPDTLVRSQGKSFNQEAKSIILHQWQKTRSTGRSLLRYKASVLSLNTGSPTSETKSFKATMINIFIVTMDQMTTCMCRGSLLVMNPQRTQLCRFPQLYKPFQRPSAHCFGFTDRLLSYYQDIWVLYIKQENK